VEGREANTEAVGGTAGEEVPVVTVVVPCLNEARFIGPCLESILTNRFPLDRLDVIVLDGGSEDGTDTVLARYAERYPCVRILENPARVTPAAFNLGIREARGDLVMIMSAHATFVEGAIAKAVAFSRSSGAENVGGRWHIVPRSERFIDRAVAAALSHWFGVGNATYRTGTSRSPVWVDTAAYGCYRRDVFAQIGAFNERLIRGQDMEFNLRLKRAGGRTLFVPDIVINYYARSDLRSFVRRSFLNGVWAILPFVYSQHVPVSWRHLTPLAFVVGLSAGLGLSVTSAGWWPLLLIGGPYVAIGLVASARVARQQGQWRLAIVMPLVFATLHVPYGLGSLWGAARALVELARGVLRKGADTRIE
jgi:GT2 family glycosyltransferase